MAEQWEYKVVTGRSVIREAELNRLGSDGWELAGVVSDVSSRSYSENTGRTGGSTGGRVGTDVSLIFKRRKP